jgi:hypothetical protein
VCDEHVTGLEAVVATFDQSFTTWNAEVEASLTSIKLDLYKLNSFFARDVKNPEAPQSGVLPSVSASKLAILGSSANGPQGHRVDNTHQDCGFGKVYTQTHDLVTGMKFHPPLPPNSAMYNDFSSGHESYKSTSNFGPSPRML